LALDPVFARGFRREMPKLPALAFEIFRDLGPRLTGQRLLIACSGGLDSVVLLDVLAKLAPRLGLELAVAHIHHGNSVDRGLSQARNRARDFVSNLAKAYQLPFYSREAGSDLALVSEQDLRTFRLHSLDEIVGAGDLQEFDRVALAHHADDLLETRLIRLIRGTGPQGLASMKMLSEKSVRPFLNLSRKELQVYAEQNKVQWLEDPSNADVRYFRNWIRAEWIPLLEEKRPGSMVALARSLDLLSKAVSPLKPPSKIEQKRFDRKDFHLLSQPEKGTRLAGLVLSFRAADFGQSKIIEVLKRLDRLEVSRQRHANFVVGGIEWRVTPLEIEALRINQK
jgi:tRNA(Ile)-lysidine synthase